MCGIAGILLKFPDEKIENKIKLMTMAIEHRGPDGLGYFHEDKIALSNARLSILDIEAGDQPFISDCGNVVVVQNGEIYNFIEVRSELEKSHGVKFRTNCDTEVILQSYLIWGESFVTKLNGMFAISIYNKKANKCWLFRDRLGVKPLYLYIAEDLILFSSEIKSFIKHPDFDKKVNAEAIYHYLTFNYIPIKETIFNNVFHVVPGTYLEIDLSNLERKETVYWDIENIKEVECLSEDELIDKIDKTLIDAVKIRLRSDVPIAAFLSGGLDSSLVCAIAKKVCNYDLETFSIGFNGSRFDESDVAISVAKYLNLPNTVFHLDYDIIEHWHTTTLHNDQPHGDISFIPTYLLAEKVSKKYKVVLTGDGGDEAFGGYEKYWSLLDDNEWDSYFDTISLFREASPEFENILLNDFTSKTKDYSSMDLFKKVISKYDKLDKVNKGLLFDVKQLLPGNNLVKPDKMGMANSLEARSPLLDYRLFELMYSLPGTYKVSHDRETKSILKKLALKYLPREIVYREKQMFTVPVGDWFRSNLKEYVFRKIHSKHLASLNIFNLDEVNKLIDLHVSGEENYTREIRAILNLSIWSEVFTIEDCSS